MHTKDEYSIRRQALANQLPSRALAIIPGAEETFRNGDVHYRFRQDSDFYYLTGFNEPHAMLLLASAPDSSCVLFNQPEDSIASQWTGQRLGQANAPTVLGVDAAYPISTFLAHLEEYLLDKEAIYFPIGRSSHWQEQVLNAWAKVKGLSRRSYYIPAVLHDLSPLIGELRLIKRPVELSCIEKATAVSIDAHQRAMRASRIAQYEYQLEAELVFEFNQQGCRNIAYDPIVASGNNACVLHYTANNKPLKKGDLVLIDAGCEYENYAADITRTFPLNGRFSPEQREIYQLVLSAQKQALALIRPGCLWHSLQETIVKVLTQGLIDLGILHGSLDDLLAEKAYLPFYMHGSGHWLGLDVHDAGAYKKEGQWRALAKGMVLTVEPGLYIRSGTANVAERWQGIGVRIEDDIAVTSTGYINLTQALPSSVEDVEAYIQHE